MRFTLRNLTRLFVAFALVFLIAFIFVMPVMAQVSSGQPVNPVQSPAQKAVAVAIAISASIKGIRELLDKFGVAPTSHVYVGINVLASAAAIIALQPPDHLLSIDFGIKLITAVLTVAGVHDIGHYLSGGHD